MGFRFHRSKRLIPGVRLNLSGSGPSMSLGVKGARLNIGPKGTRTTVGVPGSGFSHVSQKSWGGGAPVSSDAYGPLTPAQLKAMMAATWFDVGERVARGEVPEARERDILALVISATPLAKVRADLRILDAFYAAARGALPDEEYHQTRSLYLDAVARRKPSDPVAPWPQAQLADAFGEVSDDQRAAKLAEVQKLHDDASGVTARRAQFKRLLWIAGGLLAAFVVAFALLIGWLNTIHPAASGSASTDPAIHL